MAAEPTIEDLKIKVRELEKELKRQKKIEGELRESEEKFKTLFENANDELIYIDTEGRVVELNSKIEDLFGYTRDEVLGRKFTEFDFLKPEFLEQSLEILNDVISGKPMQGIIEFEGIHKSGRKVFFEGSSGLIKKEGEIQGVLIIIRDITERKKTEKELIAYQEILRSLSNELLLSEEKERRRIARDLHDSVGQALAISKIKLASLQEISDASEYTKTLNEVRELINQTILDTRTLTFELSPPVLYELGFEAAVEWLIDQVQERHGIIIDFHDDGLDKEMNDSTKVLMFRVARELLINTVKHSKTETAEVAVQKDGTNIQFSIQDYGIGFDPEKIDPHASGTGGFGLFSIRDRLSHIDGCLEIESEHGTGTRVTMIVPTGKEEKR